MKSKRKTELYFEEIGEQFDQWMSMYDVRQRIKLIMKSLPPNSKDMSCLEVGCGSGKISESVVSMVKNLTVVDISEKLAKGVGKSLQVAWGEEDACHLSMANNSFDIVISSECIEHTPNPRRALSEMVRVLKPNGTLVVTSPNKMWYPVLWLSMVLKIRRFEGNENWLFPWSAAKFLKKHNMQVIRCGGCHLFPWQIPLAKKILPLFDRCDKVLYPFMINYGICGRKLESQQSTTE
ncbi:class I SAM-dependent methyltransferase [Candidatus Uabimicrobium amorphum]|uniref:Methyltransferase type 11 n=1 Tax=Uabimicrobium amorphum TaxID=2596890 RepID=A0A5S9IP41_UABAM|nr:class I SAM-dependent methyltransferase [Candidatus Uabimicrobium amorphum]BBM85101.1 methyltransferase type 11 [Candidatus Uabimicrobium amorphum]